MQILDERKLSVLWEWGDSERKLFTVKFKTNLLRCLKTINRRMAGGQPFGNDELDALAEEFRDAGDLLEESSWNCAALACALMSLAGGDETLGQSSTPSAKRLASAVGKEVVLTQTTIDDLKGQPVILEQINGNRALIRHKDDYWETAVDRLMLLAPESAAEACTLPVGTQRPEKMFIKLKGCELGNLIQFLSADVNTGELGLRVVLSGDLGYLFFEKGRLVHAEYGEAKGVDALARMLVQGEMEGHFFENQETPEHTLKLSTDQLLLQAAVLADNYAEAAKES